MEAIWRRPAMARQWVITCRSFGGIQRGSRSPRPQARSETIIDARNRARRMERVRKTTLLARLIPLLTGEGLRVSTIKHAHHNFDVDKPGKDSWTHRQAGASEVLVVSDTRWALMHELRATRSLR